MPNTENGRMIQAIISGNTREKAPGNSLGDLIVSGRLLDRGLP